MKVLVTGGSGKMGPAVVERLARRGDQLTVIGRRPTSEIKGAYYRRCDITDFGSLLAEVRGMDAIVHLAAIPNPFVGSPEEIFRVNCCGTANLFEAAARAGIGRIVCASSINTVGLYFGMKPFPIPYFPIDEDLPGYTTDAYSFSKQVIELVAAYHGRRDGITSVCLRFPHVATARATSEEPVRAHAKKARECLEKLLSFPEPEQRARIGGWTELFDDTRYGRPRRTTPEWDRELHSLDPILAERTSFWTMIDERDAAQAIERALAARLSGSHVFFANDSHNQTGIPTETLVRTFFPEAELRNGKLEGTTSLVSIERARTLIGFAPEYSASRWLSGSGA